MAPKQGSTMASISGLIDSDSDVNMASSPRSNQENEPVTKSKKPAQTTTGRPRGRPPGKLSSNVATKATKSKSANSKRAPLQEYPNEQHPTDAEDTKSHDEIAEEMNDPISGEARDSEPELEPKQPAARRGRPPKARLATKEKKLATSKVKGMQKDGEFEYTPTREKESKTGSKSKAIPKASINAGRIDDPEPSDHEDHTMLSIEEDDVIEPTKYSQMGISRKVNQQSSSTNANARRKVDSNPDSERGDVALRRKLGEMTRKFETLESRYKNLKEIGITEAEANFDRLKKNSEQRTKAANDLIDSLRKELEAQCAASSEAREQSSDLQTVQKRLATSETQAAELSSSLNAMKKENQALHAKLSAARTMSDSQRNKMSASKPAAATNGETAQSLQMAQLKQDLYEDLTGLIIRNVDKHDDGVVYDCLQTGCNGSLHFKLSVASEESASAYDDVEFQYEPRLDRDRDEELIDIMPEYLSEEITFSRGNAAKFYSRIADTLTKRLIHD